MIKTETKHSEGEKLWKDFFESYSKYNTAMNKDRDDIVSIEEFAIHYFSPPIPYDFTKIQYTSRVK